MKRYLIISISAIAVITCLQGYYVHLQYNKYIEEKIREMNRIVRISLDKDIAEREDARSCSRTKGEAQHFKFNVYLGKNAQKANAKRSKRITFENINIDSLRKLGLVETKFDAMSLISMDMCEALGRPLNLNGIDSMLSDYMGNRNGHSVLILDSNKKVIKATRSDYSGWYATKDICISLSNPRFIRVMVDIKPSDFIMKSVWSLSLSLLFSIIIIGVDAYQLTAIRRREELLNARELSLNGTIHDLKSPLNALITLLGVLRMDEEDEAKLDAMKTVEDRARKLVNTIETILITAGGTGRRILLNKKPADIGTLAMKAKADVDLLAGGKEHEITVDDRTGGATATVDAAYIENVLRNLMENAVKYSDPGVKVCVRIEREGSMTRVSVSDTGWGIPRKCMRHLFRQFYRVPGRESVKGFGVGLALVKYIIELHGGRIKVESTEDRGSVFTFTLPDK